MSRDLDIRLLRAFEAVVRTGGVMRAATALNRSQPVISQQLRKLEDLVGHALFCCERSWKPTVEGERLLAAARRILSLNDSVFTDLGRKIPIDPLKIGVPEEFAAHCLSHALQRFTGLWPEVPIEIEVGLSGTLKQRLHDGYLDVILAKQPKLRASDSDTVWNEKLVWVASEKFSARPDQPVPLVVFNDNCVYRHSAVQSLTEIDRSYRIAATCSSWSTIQATVAAGVGYSITSRNFPLEGLREATHEERLPTLPNVSVLLMRGPKSHTPAGDSLADILREAATDAMRCGGSPAQSAASSIH